MSGSAAGLDHAPSPVRYAGRARPATPFGLAGIQHADCPRNPGALQPGSSLGEGSSGQAALPVRLHDAEPGSPGPGCGGGCSRSAHDEFPGDGLVGPLKGQIYVSGGGHALPDDRLPANTASSRTRIPRCERTTFALELGDQAVRSHRLEDVDEVGPVRVHRGERSATRVQNKIVGSRRSSVPQTLDIGLDVDPSSRFTAFEGASVGR